MARKPALKKPQPLTAAIIAYLNTARHNDGDRASEARLPARRAGPHPQPRRQLRERDLRPTSLRHRGAGLAAEVGGLS